MKKYQSVVYLVCLLLVLPALDVAANAQFRMAVLAGTDFAERPSYLDIGAGFNDPANVFEGIKLEVITQHIVGFGINGLVRFTETSVADIAEDPDAWWFDWNGDAFLSAHLLGGGSLVDPFLEVGYGCVGRVNISKSRSGYWVEDEDGEWSYSWYEQNVDGLTNLSLYPVVSAGVAFDLTGFLIGAKISYRPIVHSIPAAPIDNFPLTRFHFGIFGGLALGGHR